MRRLQLIRVFAGSAAALVASASSVLALSLFANVKQTPRAAVERLLYTVALGHKPY